MLKLILSWLKSDKKAVKATTANSISNDMWLPNQADHEQCGNTSDGSSTNKRNKVNNLHNPYLEAIEMNKWNSLHAYHIEKESTWRFIAMLSLVFALAISIYAIYMVSLDRHKTIVFKQDSQGNLSLLGVATTTFKVDNKIIAHQLANFISCLREVPQDLNLKRKNIAVVHKMISSNIQNQVDQLIINQYQHLARNESIFVKFTSLEPLSGGASWEIHWQEQNSLNASITNWSAVVSFKLMKNVPINVQLVNPIGLIITYVNVVEDINDNTK